jgi:hypothetical protein
MSSTKDTEWMALVAYARGAGAPHVESAMDLARHAVESRPANFATACGHIDNLLNEGHVPTGDPE